MRLFGYDIRLVNLAKVSDSQTRSVRNVYERQPSVIGWVEFNYPFADTAVTTCLKMITNRANNAVFTAEKDLIASAEVINFVSENVYYIIKSILSKGYIIVDALNLRFLKAGELQKFGDTLTVPDNCVLIQSEVFRADGVSDFEKLKSIFAKLDAVENADGSLITNYGAMGVISPEHEKIRPDTRENIQKDYGKNYGITFGKWKLIIADEPLRFSQIKLPISELRLSDKQKNAILSICAYFDIPKDLHPLFEDATYQNARDKEVQFYSNVIHTYVKMLQSCIEKIYKKRSNVPNRFWHDFVGVYSLESRRYLTVQRTREEWQFWNDVIENENTTDLQRENARNRQNKILDEL